MKRISNDDLSQAQAKKEEAEARAQKAREKAQKAARVARMAARALDDSERRKREQAKHALGGCLLGQLKKQEPRIQQQWFDRFCKTLDPADYNLILDALGSPLPRFLLCPAPPHGWKPGQ